MSYLIDGHNLIPHLQGMSLQALDDEQELIGRLQEFCRLRRKQVIVYFDQAAPGTLPVRKYGSVTAHFVRSGKTADAAIREKLKLLGPAAKNWSVVSSDGAVQAAAKAARARVIPSRDFAQEMAHAYANSNPDPGEYADAGLTAEETEEWLALFTHKKPPLRG
jgi:hypothetical protein